jgi:hypothetical protein
MKGRQGRVQDRTGQEAAPRTLRVPVSAYPFNALHDALTSANVQSRRAMPHAGRPTAIAESR